MFFKGCTTFKTKYLFLEQISGWQIWLIFTLGNERMRLSSAGSQQRALGAAVCSQPLPFAEVILWEVLGFEEAACVSVIRI